MTNSTGTAAVMENAASWMASKFAGTCLVCRERIAAGEPIAYVRSAGASHAHCYALKIAAGYYADLVTFDGQTIAESIANAKSFSNVRDYEISEDWYISRMFRLFVPTLPSEDAAWDAEADADRADALLAEYANQPQEARVQLVELAPVTVSLSQGTYTIVFESEGSVTLKISKPNDNGTAFIGVLTGPNNENDYSPVAVLNGGVFKLTRYARAMNEKTLTRRALAWIVAATDDQRRAAGQAYALASAKCYRCGRTLTVVSSIDAGLGPICAGKEYAD